MFKGNVPGITEELRQFISEEPSVKQVYCPCIRMHVGFAQGLHDYSNPNDTEHNLICVECGQLFFFSSDLCLCWSRRQWTITMCEEF